MLCLNLENVYSDQENRRRKCRVPVSYPPVVFVRHDEKILHAKPVDFSAGGTQIELPVRLGQDVPVFMIWDTERSGIMKINGVVRWCRKGDRNRWYAGVEFNDVERLEGKTDENG